jgi:hypothetical protein
VIAFVASASLCFHLSTSSMEVVWFHAMAGIMLHHPSIKTRRAGVRSRVDLVTDFERILQLMCGSPLAERLGPPPKWP